MSGSPCWYRSQALAIAGARSSGWSRAIDTYEAERWPVGRNLSDKPTAPSASSRESWCAALAAWFRRTVVSRGTVQRARPRLMTVATMLIGLVPLLWGTSSGADVMKRIAERRGGGPPAACPRIGRHWRSRSPSSRLAASRLRPLRCAAGASGDQGAACGADDDRSSADRGAGGRPRDCRRFIAGMTARPPNQRARPGAGSPAGRWPPFRRRTGRRRPVPRRYTRGRSVGRCPSERAHRSLSCSIPHPG